MATPLYVDQAARGLPTLFHVDTSQSWGNPSSLHRSGRDARNALLQARQQIAQSLSLPVSTNPQALSKQILFTSGGTESNNMVILQATWKFIITVSTEHHAVYYPVQYLANHTACEVVFLAVDGQGRIANLDELRRVLSRRLPQYLGEWPSIASPHCKTVQDWCPWPT
jgi:cysteine sulfinate desulfinase/cysteine desulfurase-like protein